MSFANNILRGLAAAHSRAQKISEPQALKRLLSFILFYEFLDQVPDFMPQVVLII